MRKIYFVLAALGIVACGPMSGGTVLDNSSFMKRLNDCHDSYSCRELHSQALDTFVQNKCDKPATISCANARRNVDLSFEKYARLTGAEQRSAEQISQLAEQERQARVKQLQDEQRAVDLKTSQECEDTLELRAKARHEFAALAKVKQDNADWVVRNCKATRTDKRICRRVGNVQECYVDEGTPILNCGSNKRPMKFDGTRLSDTDILENHVGSSLEDEQRLSDDAFKAEADQRVCDAANLRLQSNK